MSRLMTWPISPLVRSMQVGGMFEDGDEDAPFIGFELEAPDAERAERAGHEIVTAIREAQGLPARRLPVAWVAPLDSTVASSQRFLDEARDLFASEHFEMAVVAAHVHLELQIRTLIRRAVESTEGRWPARLLKMRSHASLGTDLGLVAVEIFLGLDPTQVPEWPEYRAHVIRRNGVVHEGHAVSEQEAARSLSVVTDLWKRLAGAARTRDQRPPAHGKKRLAPPGRRPHRPA